MYRFFVDLLQPTTIFFVLMGGALVHLWRSSSGQRRVIVLLAVPFALLWLSYTPVVGFLARGTLEWQYAPRRSRPEGIDAILVLGGYVVSPSDAWPRTRLGWDSLNRCLLAAEMYADGAPCRVIVTGGKVDATKPGLTIADTMAEFLQTQGVAAEHILIENESTTTFENAVRTRSLVESMGIKSVAMITDATHLMRAQTVFEAQGFQTIPIGCDYYNMDWSLLSFLPRAGAAGDIDRAAHEWIGQAYYLLRGRHRSRREAMEVVPVAQPAQ